PQPDPGRRLRQGIGPALAQPDPAAGRYRDAGPGQPGHAERALSPALMPLDRRARLRARPADFSSPRSNTPRNTPSSRPDEVPAMRHRPAMQTSDRTRTATGHRPGQHAP